MSRKDTIRPAVMTVFRLHYVTAEFCVCTHESLPFFVQSLPQMAVLEIQSNGDSSYVSQEAINSAIQSLEDPLQRVRKRERDEL